MDMNNPEEPNTINILQNTLKSNQEAQKEIARVLKNIEDTKKKKEALFKELGITPEMEKENLSVADLTPGAKKIYDVMEKEFLAELEAKNINTQPEKAKKSKSSLTLSKKKRMRI